LEIFILEKDFRKLSKFQRFYYTMQELLTDEEFFEMMNSSHRYEGFRERFDRSILRNIEFRKAREKYLEQYHGQPPRKIKLLRI